MHASRHPQMSTCSVPIVPVPQVVGVSETVCAPAMVVLGGGFEWIMAVVCCYRCWSKAKVYYTAHVNKSSLLKLVLSEKPLRVYILFGLQHTPALTYVSEIKENKASIRRLIIWIKLSLVYIHWFDISVCTSTWLLTRGGCRCSIPLWYRTKQPSVK